MHFTLFFLPLPFPLSPPPSSPSSQAYVENPRTKWVCDWPGQVAICVSQIYWTMEVHEAIRNGPQSVKEYHTKLTKQLEGIVEMVRGKLPKQTRTTLGALVVMDVHARDVTLELVEKGNIMYCVFKVFVYITC